MLYEPNSYKLIEPKLIKKKNLFVEILFDIFERRKLETKMNFFYDIFISILKIYVCFRYNYIHIEFYR